MNLSDNDKKKIEAAVRDAEAKTSGEIVPLIVDTSDAYHHADLVGGILGMALFFLAGIWALTVWTPMASALLLAAGFIAGFLVVRFVPNVKRFLVGRRVAELEVYQRAVQAFHENKLTATRDRTGILIMASMLERRVQVLADSGIDAKVPPGAWDEVVRLVIAGILRGSVADGLVDGIRHCEGLLAREFPGRDDDRNELPDAPRAQ